MAIRIDVAPTVESREGGIDPAGLIINESKSNLALQYDAEYHRDGVYVLERAVVCLTPLLFGVHLRTRVSHEYLPCLCARGGPAPRQCTESEQ